MENVVRSHTDGLNTQRRQADKRSPNGRCSIATRLHLGGAEVAEADHVRPLMHVDAILGAWGAHKQLGVSPVQPRCTENTKRTSVIGRPIANSWKRSSFQSHSLISGEPSAPAHVEGFQLDPRTMIRRVRRAWQSGWMDSTSVIVLEPP